MAGSTASMVARVLAKSNAGTPSAWSGLNPNLIASIYPVDVKTGMALGDQIPVQGPISDANIEMALNWQSPFENSGPESKLPSLMAMVQSGQFTPIAQAIQATGALGEQGNAQIERFKKSIEGLEGRTGITKLNSRQVFTGMPPLRITMTLHFRAMTDAREEVVAPLERLTSWAVPQELSPDGSLTRSIKAAGGDGKVVDILFPSLSPQVVGFTYAGNRYPPMVVENVSRQLDVERDANGNEIALAVQVTLATLTAIDRADVAALFRKG